MSSRQPVVGIIGAGTVGTALIAAFESKVHLLVRDPRLGDASSSMEALAKQCSVVFVAVPTPMAANGDANTSAFDEVVGAFVSACEASTNAPVFCVKSAVPPDVILRVQKQHPHIRLVVSPEFLRERSPTTDMISMRALVLGGAPADCLVVEQLFRDHSHVTGPMRTHNGVDAIGAALLKYQENCFLALKVSFMNEFHDLFLASGTASSWEDLQQAFHLDHERMGTTHWHVPGPDGRHGWGGRCLPKDTSALRAYGERLAVATPLMAAAQERNQQDRVKPTDNILSTEEGGPERCGRQDARATTG